MRLNQIAVIAAMAAMASTPALDISRAIAQPTAGSARVPVLEPARAGSICTFGPYHSGAIGLTILAGPDVRGPAGNEVNDVSEIFYWIPDNTSAVGQVGLAGWLISSFDGRHAFAPAVPQSESPQTLLGTYRLAVTPEPASHLPIGAWLSEISELTKAPLPPSLRAVAAATDVGTALAPCFATPWDGKS